MHRTLGDDVIRLLSRIQDGPDLLVVTFLEDAARFDVPASE